jgi:hypothetical protein
MAAMDKHHILSEIKRTAAANGGRPLGRERFLTETGIREIDWRGKHWARWSDAIREAGLVANALVGASDEQSLLGKLAGLARERGHFPTAAEMKLKRREDQTFPSSESLYRLGRRSELIGRLRDFCMTRDEFSDVVGLLPDVQTLNSTVPEERAAEASPDGFVYLIQSGRHFKIGRTNALGRREYEIALQLPERAQTVHTIRTDDPIGIEAYWHSRFSDRRRNGEWFELKAEDVRAFKRRKFM